MKKYFAFLIAFSLSVVAFSQNGIDLSNDSTLIQFSGMVITDANNQLIPVPYATVSVKSENRGTYTNYRGFFSLVVHRGDEVTFSAIGFSPTIFTIPDTIKGDRFYAAQLITDDTINLPETVIFPWPDRDHFKLEFLAMDVSEDLADRARENLAEKSLSLVRERTKMDANENADYYLRQEAQSYYSLGQTPPMNIFNPMAWAQFFKAWKEGEYKKKKKQ
ncbi:MAG: carboxypeptidase-like regulatory domain-containing protein [Saprospiraceae bacterium]